MKENLTQPTTAQLEAEVARVSYRSRFGRVLRSTIYALVIVAAIAVLITTLWLPILQIYGSSMTPTMEEGEIVVAVKGSHFRTGDVIAFYYNNKMLVKRVIATAGQWVNIDEDGTVYVDNVKLDEPYLTEKALGDCDLKLPYQVPGGRLFVMGDTAPHPLTPATRWWAVWRRNRSLEKSCSASGRWSGWDALTDRRKEGGYGKRKAFKRG